MVQFENLHLNSSEFSKTHKHDISLFKSSLICLSSVLLFSVYKLCTYFNVKFILSSLFSNANVNCIC